MLTYLLEHNSSCLPHSKFLVLNFIFSNQMLPRIYWIQFSKIPVWISDWLSVFHALRSQIWLPRPYQKKKKNPTMEQK